MIKCMFFSVLFSLSFVLFQTAILDSFFLFPIVPDFLLILVLFLGLYNGSLFGEIHGFFTGLLIDFLTIGPLGLYALLFSLLGFLSGLLKKNVNTSGFFLVLFLGFLAFIIKTLILYLLNFFFPNLITYYSLLSPATYIELGLTALFTPIIFKFLNLFSSYLLIENPGR